MKNKTRGSDDHSDPCSFHGYLWHFIFVHFPTGSCMWPELLRTLVNSTQLTESCCALCFFWVCPPVSTPLRELKAENQDSQCCLCIGVVVTLVGKDGDRIWRDQDQNESSLPGSAGEHRRQSSSSHCACSVVVNSTSHTRKPSCAQLGGILLSTWKLSTSFIFF